VGSVNKRIVVWVGLSIKKMPYLKTNSSKKGKGCGSSGGIFTSRRPLFQTLYWELKKSFLVL
jgi:hypothetical protein